VRVGQTITGRAAPGDLPRLAEALEGHWGGGSGDRSGGRAAGDVARWPAAFRLAFARDERGLRVITGEASLTVVLPCQRCLEAVEIALECPMRLGLIEAEAQADALPEDLDPVVVAGEDQLRPLDLVEDELLLALPLVPRHPDGACAPGIALGAAGAGAGAGNGEVADHPRGAQAPGGEATDSGRPNPFAALAALKDDPPRGANS
jgi:uncharacterized protein